MKPSLLAWALCALPSAEATSGPPPGAAVFEATPAQCRASLLVDVRLANPTRIEPVARALREASIPSVLLVRSATLDGFEPSLDAAMEAGHELGLLLEQSKGGKRDAQRPTSSPWIRIRNEARDLRRSTRKPPRAVGILTTTPGLEGVLEMLGFTLLLPAPGAALEAPRRSEDPQGSKGAAIVLTAVEPGEGSDGTGGEGALAATLDRVALALELGAHPVVRLSLPSGLEAAGLTPLLARWRAEVLEPCGAEILTSREAESAVRVWLHGQSSPWATLFGRSSAPLPPEEPPPMRVVAPGELLAAIDALPCDRPGSTLPRTLPGNLSLTEAYGALAQYLQEPARPEITVPALLPPQSSPRSVLGPVGASLPASAIRQTFAELSPKEGDQVPSFLRVSDQALTAPELLCAMAGAALAQDPVKVNATYSPAPYTPGLGWGAVVE